MIIATRIIIDSGAEMEIIDDRLTIPGYGVTRLLLVTDRDIIKLGLHQTCLDAFEKSGITVTLFGEVEPDPSLQQIEQGVELLKQHRCDGVLGFGGGSPIDAAKLIAARGTNQKSIDKMEGPFKVGKKPLPLFAVPTTAGTGSEATMAAVASIRDLEQVVTRVAIG